MSSRKELRGLIHDAIEKGADSVEEIHKTIASLPLKILEEVGFLAGAAKEVEGIQNRSIGAVYKVIRQVNDQVETLAAEILSERRKGRSTSA